MPTLHLIDADSTQACPAVLASVRASINANDRVLLLGGPMIREYAQQAGIVDAQQLSVPFGKAALGLPALKRWLRDRSAFGLIHCWTPGALHAASLVSRDTPKHLSLGHTPRHTQLNRLLRLAQSKYAANIAITADNTALTKRIVAAGIPCRTAPIPLPEDGSITLPPDRRGELRRAWGVSREKDFAIALVSDHPQLSNSLHAAAIVVLGLSTLTDEPGTSSAAALILHPAQPNLRRARALLDDQSTHMGVAQDAGVIRPWDVLGACDAALAIGPDAGGLSLRWALHSGLPVIASVNGPAGDHRDAGGDLRLASTDYHKDLAHLLHTALQQKL
ncbi:MAG: hypothetical protein R3C45_22830 [Phycisphaerales bacterium]